MFCFVPPTISVLLDEKGTEVEGKVGPYNVGATLLLNCDILGGNSLENNSLKNMTYFIISLLRTLNFTVWYSYTISTLWCEEEKTWPPKRKKCPPHAWLGCAQESFHFLNFFSRESRNFYSIRQEF